MKVNYSNVIKGIILTIIPTGGFVLCIYGVRESSLSLYAAIDQYILILCVLFTFFLIGANILYLRSLYGVLPVILLCIIALYVSMWILPSEIPQYTQIGRCNQGGLYIDFSGPWNGSETLIYYPDKQTIPADVSFHKSIITFHSSQMREKYQEQCEIDTKYQIR
jgi:hypothetical protein